MVSNAFVVLAGMGTVFFGLICLVVIIKIVGAVVGAVEKPKVKMVKEAKSTASVHPTGEMAAAIAAVLTATEKDTSNIAAVIVAALTEELGEEPSSICITKI